MRVVLIGIVLAAGLSAGPAAADRRHYVNVWPYVGFGYYGHPFGYYGPYYSPW